MRPVVARRPQDVPDRENCAAHPADADSFSAGPEVLPGTSGGGITHLRETAGIDLPAVSRPALAVLLDQPEIQRVAQKLALAGKDDVVDHQAEGGQADQR